VATFNASTGNLNPGTVAITTWSALLLAIEGGAAELNSLLIPLASRRQHESPMWQNFPFAVFLFFRLKIKTGQLAVFRCCRPDRRPEEQQHL
jgi:hypothetical protein